jgi:2-polyprenyl-3-methyl-5-hydroxy-6-metoxy-1,4-benzoquinol methylase
MKAKSVSVNPFYSSIAGYYDKIFPLKSEPVQFVLNSWLEKSSELIALDVGCSTGQLAYELAEQGIRVTAMDLDPEMIREAKQKTSTSKIKPEFRTGDMTQLTMISGKEQFDGIICFGNTLPHLTRLTDRKLFFSESFSSLKSGGKLLLQIVNYDQVLTKKTATFPVIDNEFIRFERYYEYSKEQDLILFKTNLRIKSSGQMITNSVELYPVPSKEISRLVMEAGFTSAEFFGNFKKDPFEVDSPALIVSAMK